MRRRLQSGSAPLPPPCDRFLSFYVLVFWFSSTIPRSGHRRHFSPLLLPPCTLFPCQPLAISSRPELLSPESSISAAAGLCALLLSTKGLSSSISFPPFPSEATLLLQKTPVQNDPAGPFSKKVPSPPPPRRPSSPPSPPSPF